MGVTDPQRLEQLGPAAVIEAFFAFEQGGGNVDDLCARWEATLVEGRRQRANEIDALIARSR